MSQLEGYLKSLNENELAAISSLKVKGQEKKIFESVLTALKNPEVKVEDLGLSETHTYKIHSVLLKKIFKKQVPEGGITLLKHLLGKNNFILFKHELKASEKFIKTLPASEQESYYLQCFHLLIDLPFKFFDDKLIDQYGLKYLESKNERQPSDDAYIKYHKLFAKANCCAAKRNASKAFGIVLSDLLRMEEVLAPTDFHLAKYYLYRTFCSYYSYYEKDNISLLTYLQKAIDLADKVQYFFPVNIHQFLGLLHADVLFTIGKVDEAYQSYKAIFVQGITEEMYGYYYHCEQYALVLIVKQKYQEAEALIQRSFNKSLHEKLDIYATRGAMTFAKLYLSQNELKKALGYISLGKEINEKSFYLPFDVQLRVLENLFFLLKGDIDFAGQLAAKNLKFAQSQKDVSQFKSYVHLWKLIVALSSQKNRTSKKPDNTLVSELILLSKHFVSLYCELIEAAVYKAFT